MVSCFHTSLFLYVFVATRTLTQPLLSTTKCPAQHCSLSHLEDMESNPCLELNKEIVYRCQKYKCVMNITDSGTDYTLQPGEEIGCYRYGDCIPFRSQMREIVKKDAGRMGCYCIKSDKSFLILCS